MRKMNAQSVPIYIDHNRTIDRISPLLFGSFIEHLGRCVYGGIYDPSSPLADEQGLRTDVLAALRELNFSILRYPGGNFVSGYDWKDGIGPLDQRPRRRELAWGSIETNQFGTDQFIDLCHKLNAEPMLGLNFGTGTIQSASELVEYCNAPAGTEWADGRIANGHPRPHHVRYWCLGNEMDGPWQIGRLTADQYGQKAREAAKLMKWQDPSIKLIACGSSNDHLTTYPQWDRITLEHCWEQIDYLSLHHYAGNPENDTESYLAYGLRLEQHLETIAATLHHVKTKLRSSHDVHLAWDEWNVWYRQTNSHGGWREAPPLLEEVYNLEDALVIAQWMNLFLRRCDILKIACLAQAVNVLAPIRTAGDRLVKQTIFYPFLLFRRHAVGESLDLQVQCPRYDTRHGPAPLIDASATFDRPTGRGAIFLVNRSRHETLDTRLIWQSDAPQRIACIYTLAGDDPKTANTFEQPNNILPRMTGTQPIQNHQAQITLPQLSLTVVATEGME